jgi:RHS repeat-associated protein
VSPNLEIERIYRYDRVGNLLGRHDKQRGNTVFQYDPTGRILNAKGGTEEFFEFYPAGNMQPKGLGGFSVAGNRLEVYQDLRYEYDVHGNVSTRKKGAHEEAEFTFTWNAEHQLKEAKITRKGTEQTTRYEYDALGRRTRKIDTFGATEYLWDGDLMIESRWNNKNALYLFEPKSFVPLATVQDEKTYWYQCDQVGAPQELTDKEGQIVWAVDYKIWGETTLRKTGTDGPVRYPRSPEPPPALEQPFRFQGQQFDEETGLHYNRFRYYDPGVGRFVSQDPIGLLGGSNLFAYAPNPLGWVDPFGLANKKKKGECTECPDDSKRAKSNPERGRFDTEHDGPLGYDKANSAARKNAGDLGQNTQKMYDPKTRTQIGEMSADGKRGWRVDDDHLNWWDWSGGKKGQGGKYGHEFFPKSQSGPHSEHIGYAPWQ